MDQDVLQLQIPVKDVDSAEFFKRIDNLLQNVQTVFLFQLPSNFDELFQIAPIAVFKELVAIVYVNQKTVEVHDIGALDLLEDLDFCEKALGIFYFLLVHALTSEELLGVLSMGREKNLSILSFAQHMLVVNAKIFQADGVLVLTVSGEVGPGGGMVPAEFAIINDPFGLRGLLRKHFSLHLFN